MCWHAGVRRTPPRLPTDALPATTSVLVHVYAILYEVQAQSLFEVLDRAKPDTENKRLKLGGRQIYRSSD